jgi:hypothetical protein
VSLLDLAIDTSGSGIAILAHVRDDGLEMQISGSAEIPAAAVMSSLVQALHAQALALGVATVTIDFTNLEFMSSSCFKSLVTWVNDISELEEAKRYKVRFRTNAGIPWQRRSLHALKTMATDLISVET